MKRTNNFLLTLILFFGIISANAAGEVDSSFKGYLAKLGSGRCHKSVIQSDGKILVSGSYSLVNGLFKNTLVRFNTDGTVDTTFDSSIFASIALNGSGTSLAIQSNGKIIVAGTRFVRLNSDGSLDTVFNSQTSVSDISIVYDMKVSSDDKIVLSGVRGGNTNSNVITRLNADGTLDLEKTSSSLVFRLALLSNGKIVFYDNDFRFVKRLNQDLTLDTTFTQVNINSVVYSMEVQPDDKTLFQGIFTQTNGTSSPNLVRVNTDGTIDASFVGNASTGSNSIYALTILPNGKILSGTTLRNSDGTRDNSFVATSIQAIWDVEVQSDGKFVTVGELPMGSTVAQSLVVRYNSSGSVDTSYQAAVGSFSYGTKVLVQQDNKILVNGDFNYSGGIIRSNLTRLNADGTADTTFNTPNNYNLYDVFPNGKIMVTSGGINVTRLNSDGSQDITFPNIIININDIKALPDGKVLIARPNSLERYNADGTLDPSFIVPTDSNIYKIKLQADGKILIGGSFTQVNGTSRSKIARLNSDGTLDTSFNSPAGGINGVVLNFVISSEGKFVISGSFSGISFNTREGLARLNTDGSLDLSFVPPQSFSLDDINVQADGKVLLGGSVIRCRRLNTNGTIDLSFSCIPTSYNSDTPRIRGIALQSDGKIIVTGDFLQINGILAPGIARIRGNSGTTFDFDGDGKADIAVYRPSNNNWYRLNSSNGSFVQLNFGIAADQIAPADFDNDGKFDLSIFRPGTGTWWYRDVANGNFLATQWGASGDLSIPSDVDGDGKADRVVFRPSNGGWYRLKSATGQFDATQFGLNGDVPVIVDFDGDGKSDIAVFRPSSGTWYWLESSTGQFCGTQFGQNGDLAVPADYDGDGKTELAVFRQSTGDWFFIDSSTGLFRHYNFGITGDKPIAADYDGDGKADIAVYRPSLGTWYLQRSQLGFTSIQFGIAEDIPVPNAFVR